VTSEFNRETTPGSQDVMDAFRLNGRVALVTGAGRGLGQAMAIALAQAGADLALIDVEEEGLHLVSKDVAALGRKSFIRIADVTQGDQVKATIDDVVAALGSLHILVNNAGVTTGSPFENLPEDDWDKVLAVNMTGVFNFAKWTARYLINAGSGGSVINIASISGLVGNRGGNNSHYCATKGGVIALTRSLSVEWAPHNIRVNAIAPGYFVTPMTDRLKHRDAVFYQELVDRVPLGRFGDPSDLTGAVVYLASPASAFVTGSVLVIDGGYTAW
jgi:NAD(P)-dependent dehydrogenase (short-subunit alcohol dehydrogenase family)